MFIFYTVTRRRNIPNQLQLKIHRNIALDQLLLKSKRNKVIERRLSVDEKTQRPKKINVRRATNIDSAVQPASILLTNKIKNVPFSRTGRRRKSVSFNLPDNEENEASTTFENGVEDEQPLIQFDVNISQHSSQHLGTTGILESIGFDGPIQNSISSAVMTPNFQPLVEKDMNSSSAIINPVQNVVAHVGPNRPLPALIPLKINSKRRMSAKDIVLGVCNILIPSDNKENTTLNVNFNVPEFGNLHYDD